MLDRILDQGLQDERRNEAIRISLDFVLDSQPVAESCFFNVDVSLGQFQLVLQCRERVHLLEVKPGSEILREVQRKLFRLWGVFYAENGYRIQGIV
ncbi:hypothetical protein D3C74_317000 [compost metagenome]